MWGPKLKVFWLLGVGAVKVSRPEVGGQQTWARHHQEVKNVVRWYRSCEKLWNDSTRSRTVMRTKNRKSDGTSSGDNKTGEDTAVKKEQLIRLNDLTHCHSIG